jgi:hypothetical protein
MGVGDSNSSISEIEGEPDRRGLLLYMLRILSFLYLLLGCFYFIESLLFSSIDLNELNEPFLKRSIGDMATLDVPNFLSVNTGDLLFIVLILRFLGVDPFLVWPSSSIGDLDMFKGWFLRDIESLFIFLV